MADGDFDAVSLPFNQGKQRAVLGHALYDERFFTTIVQKVEAEWFHDPLVSKLFAALKAWYQKWKAYPSIVELLSSEAIRKLPQSEITQLGATAQMVKVERQQFAIAPLLEEMEYWIRTRVLMLALPKVIHTFNRQGVEKSAALTDAMMKDFHDVRFRDDGEVTFSTFRQELLQGALSQKDALTFGVTAIDRLLNPHSESGCLLPGHMTVILAPTNAGKTSLMVTVAIANILQGKSILFITHEGTAAELKHKFMRCLTGFNQPELQRAYEDPARAEEMRGFEQILDRYLVYVPLCKPGISVEEVAVVIQHHQDKRRLATGKGFHMLVNDYPAKLTCEQARGGKLETRNIHEQIYNHFVQIAVHLDIHVLVAVQTNRDGSRVNRKVGHQKHETRLLHMEDVMESWGVMTAAATVISINRNAIDEANNKISLLICKSRSSETGYTVVCNTDYDRCRTHSNDLGYFWYRGGESLSGQANAIMEDFRGKLVPAEKIRYYEVLGTK